MVLWSCLLKRGTEYIPWSEAEFFFDDILPFASFLALDEESKALCCWNKLVKMKEKLLSDFLTFSSCPSAAHIPATYKWGKGGRQLAGRLRRVLAWRSQDPVLPLTLWPWPSGALKPVLVKWGPRASPGWALAAWVSAKLPGPRTPHRGL